MHSQFFDLLTAPQKEDSFALRIAEDGQVWVDHEEHFAERLYLYRWTKLRHLEQSLELGFE